MGETTGIAWTDHTFNPWIGCEKVSPGCAHCYAETLTTGRMGLDVWGPHTARRIAAESTWKNPVKWDRAAARDGVRRRVFCASLADVFEPRLDLDRVRNRLFDLIVATPNLDWLLLTKRPDYAKSFLVTGRAATPDEVDQGFELGTVPPYYYDGHGGWSDIDVPCPIPNLWLGVSIENSRFTWRADVLREIPAAVRFISAEPLLGSLFKGAIDGSSPDTGDAPGQPDPGSTPGASAPLNLDGIDWVIVGGESGGRLARAMHPTWAKEIRDAVLGLRSFDYVGPDSNDMDGERWADVGPALFFKQWGSWAYDRARPDILLGYDGHWVDATSPHVGDLSDPGNPYRLLYPMRYMGASPGASGAVLDGSTWNEFPR